ERPPRPPDQTDHPRNGRERPEQGHTHDGLSAGTRSESMKDVEGNGSEAHDAHVAHPHQPGAAFVVAERSELSIVEPTQRWVTGDRGSSGPGEHRDYDDARDQEGDDDSHVSRSGKSTWMR